MSQFIIHHTEREERGQAHLPNRHKKRSWKNNACHDLCAKEKAVYYFLKDKNAMLRERHPQTLEGCETTLTLKSCNCISLTPVSLPFCQCALHTQVHFHFQHYFKSCYCLYWQPFPSCLAHTGHPHLFSLEQGMQYIMRKEFARVWVWDNKTVAIGGVWVSDDPRTGREQIAHCAEK